jgi:hypothetical protein
MAKLVFGNSVTLAANICDKKAAATRKQLVAAGSNDPNFQALQPTSKKKKRVQAGQDDAATHRPLLQRDDQRSLTSVPP